MHIVLVDDDEIILHIHEQMISNCVDNVNINKYNCPEKFLQNLLAGTIALPDLIISDYDMEPYNGVKLLTRLELIAGKLNFDMKKLQFYMVSGERNLEKICKNCESTIFSGYFYKPLMENHLSKLLKSDKISNH